MQEEQIKPINTEEIPKIKEIKPLEEPKKVSSKEVITELPKWSIEPPLEINRGK